MPATTPDDPRSSAAADRRGLWTGIDQASVMGVELIAAILTWTAIGWFADRALGTQPWLLVVGALIGNAAGLYLIWLRSERQVAADRAGGAVPPTDGENTRAS